MRHTSIGEKIHVLRTYYYYYDDDYYCSSHRENTANWSRTRDGAGLWASGRRGPGRRARSIAAAGTSYARRRQGQSSRI